MVMFSSRHGMQQVDIASTNELFINLPLLWFRYEVYPQISGAEGLVPNW
jgi:hypothetical protein